ncbi:sodium/proline symporter [Rheinheimera sp.]|uniref:sodium/proline symporter n=1 Tax=Rheinheimera sp. TaxID=1869214 RepID=UPI00307D2640
MEQSTAVFMTLVAYNLVLIAIGLWASKRSQSTEDFFLGGQNLGPVVAGISSSASAASAWSLLGASGATYVWGLSMLWLFPAILAGYLFNWLWLAPRLRQFSREHQVVTLTDVLIHSAGPYRNPLTMLCSFIVVFSFTFYVASQFQAAGGTFASAFGIEMRTAVVLGAAIILVYTLLGGFWAACVTDAVQGVLMMLVAVLLPAAALLQVGGFSELWRGLQLHSTPQQLSWLGGHSGIVAVGFLLGTLGVGLGNPGQPHVVNRFMALRDDPHGSRRHLRLAQWVGILWPASVFGGMLLLGLCARVLLADTHSTTQDPEQVFFLVSGELFNPVLVGIVTAAVLSAIMSTADSQLLVSASSLSYDLNKKLSPDKALRRSRMAVAMICLASALIALYAPAAIFSRVLFAWSAIGAAFGPLLIVLLSGCRIAPLYCLLSVACGFVLTVIFNWLPSPPGDYLERVLPFAVALLLAWMGREPSTVRLTQAAKT